MDGAPEKDTNYLKAAFLVALRERGVVGYAAKAIGIGRRTAYNWREGDPEFAKAWDDAVLDAVDQMETEAYRRATEGVEEPVFNQGAQVGIIRKYSDTLLIFLLKAKRPKEFRDTFRAEISGPDSGPIDVRAVDALRNPEVRRHLQRASLALTVGDGGDAGDSGDAGDDA